MPRKVRPPRPDLAVLAPLLYLAVALAALRPGLFTGHDSIVGTTGDPSLSIWALQWMPFALSHHLNPLFTSFLHYPTGVNLMWNSSILFPSLVAVAGHRPLGPDRLLQLPDPAQHVALRLVRLPGGAQVLETVVPAAVGGLLTSSAHSWPARSPCTPRSSWPSSHPCSCSSWTRSWCASGAEPG